jgi:ribosomal protein S1
VVSVGQDVEAVVLSVDHERHRIGLSMAASADGNAEDVAEAAKAAKAAAPAKFGTFADLLKKR